MMSAIRASRNARNLSSITYCCRNCVVATQRAEISGNTIVVYEPMERAARLETSSGGADRVDRSGSGNERRVARHRIGERGSVVDERMRSTGGIIISARDLALPCDAFRGARGVWRTEAVDLAARVNQCISLTTRGCCLSSNLSGGVDGFAVARCTGWTEIHHGTIGVEKGMRLSLRGQGKSCDLPGVVYRVSEAACSAQCPEVLHSAVGVEECVDLSVGCFRVTDHLAGGVYIRCDCKSSSQRAEILNIQLPTDGQGRRNGAGQKKYADTTM